MQSKASTAESGVRNKSRVGRSVAERLAMRAAFGALAVVVVACGLLVPTVTASASQSSSGKSPIVVGSVNDSTGPQAPTLGVDGKVLQAWADWTNANGGIDGHKVVLYADDTQTNPTLALSEVQQLVNQKHVLALVGTITSFTAPYASLIQKMGIPDVGDGLFTEADYTNPDFFPAGTTIPNSFYDEISLAKLAGHTKLAFLYCSESPACAQAVPIVQADAKAQGVSVTYAGGVSSTAPSYTAPCLAAKDSGATAMNINAGTSSSMRIAQACYQQGYKPMQLTGEEIESDFATQPAFQGAEAILPDVPWTDTANAGIETMYKALNKYEPGLNWTSYGETVALEWISGLLFTAATEAAHVGNHVTSADIVKGLYALHGATLGGMSPPLTYTKGKAHLVQCAFIQGIKNDKFVVPNPQQVCSPAVLPS